MQKVPFDIVKIIKQQQRVCYVPFRLLCDILQQVITVVLVEGIFVTKGPHLVLDNLFVAKSPFLG